MTISRRQFLEYSLSGTARDPGMPMHPHPRKDSNATRSGQSTLRILILGGTGFIGPHMVQQALNRVGHADVYWDTFTEWPEERRPGVDAEREIEVLAAWRAS